MKLRITREEIEKVISAQDSCEWISDSECVLDLYDAVKPATFDIVCKKKSVFADGASYLSYDEENDGWYMSGPVTDAAEAESIIRSVLPKADE